MIVTETRPSRYGSIVCRENFELVDRLKRIRAKAERRKLEAELVDQPEPSQ